MNNMTLAVTRPSYSAVVELIKLNFWRLLKTLILFEIVYVVLAAALLLLFGFTLFAARPLQGPGTTVAGLTAPFLGIYVIHLVAQMAALTVPISGLSSSVLKIYRQQERSFTVDNQVFVKMFFLLLLIIFLNAGAVIACAGIASALTGLVENDQLVTLLGTICVYGLSGLLTLSFLFSPFLIVDGANLSDALNGSLKLVTTNFIWLLPILLVAALTHIFFGFGYAILGAVYLLAHNSVSSDAVSSDAAVQTNRAPGPDPTVDDAYRSPQAESGSTAAVDQVKLHSDLTKAIKARKSMFLIMPIVGITTALQYAGIFSAGSLPGWFGLAVIAVCGIQLLLLSGKITKLQSALSNENGLS